MRSGLVSRESLFGWTNLAGGSKYPAGSSVSVQRS
jgi:hypothetical protein